MKIWFLQAIFAGLLITTLHDVYAEVDSTRLYTLPSVQVSSPKYSDLLSSTESKVVLKVEDWEGTGKNIPDLISEISGIQTRKYGGVGSFQTVSIRGMAGSKVLVYMDHTLLNSGDGGAVDLGKINLDQIERIEIYKGIAPTELGGNSVGGVIHLISKSTSNTAKFSAQSSYGSHSTQDHSVSYTKSVSEHVSMLANLSYIGSKNDFEYLNRNSTGIQIEQNKEDDFWTTRQNAEYWAIDGLYKLAYITQRYRSTVGYLHKQNEGGIPGKENQITYTAGFSNQTQRLQFDFEALLSSDMGITLESHSSFGREEPESHWSKLDKIGWSSGSDYTSMSTRLYTLQSDWQLSNIKWKNHNVRSGVTFTSNDLEPRSLQGGNTPFTWNNSRYTYSLSSELSTQWCKSFSTILGYHHEFIEDATEGGMSYSRESVEKSSQWNRYPSGRVGFLYRPTALLSFYGNLGEYYKHPGLIEIYGGRGNVLSNFNLKEENGQHSELGTRFNIKRHYAEIVYFLNRSKNAIYYYESAGLIRPTNLAATQTQGIETNVFLYITSFLKGEMHITLQDPKDVSRLDYQNNQLPNEPKFSTNTKLKFGPASGLFALEYDLGYTSILYRDEANLSPIPSSFMQDFFAKWKVYRGLRLSAGIRNLNDENYDDIYSANPSPGRQYFAGILFNTDAK